MPPLLRDGIYLEDHRPVRSQFRVGRRDPVRPVIVVHTAESGTTRAGADPRAEAVAGFIRNRTDAGSYHLIGDADSIIRLVRFENECYGDRTGSNRWAIHISLAMNAADWSSLPAARRAELVETAAEMARIAAGWLELVAGVGRPEPRLLSKAESDRADASGFISHARRDPGRREDPGPGFPWNDFFRSYSNGGSTVPVSIDPSDPAQPRMSWEELQQRLADAGFYTGAIDGDPWKQTRAAVIAALGPRPVPPIDPDLLAGAEAATDLRRSLERLLGLPGPTS